MFKKYSKMTLHVTDVIERIFNTSCVTFRYNNDLKWKQMWVLVCGYSLVLYMLYSDMTTTNQISMKPWAYFEIIYIYIFLPGVAKPSATTPHIQMDNVFMNIQQHFMSKYHRECQKPVIGIIYSPSWYTTFMYYVIDSYQYPVHVIPAQSRPLWLLSIRETTLNTCEIAQVLAY